MASLAIMGKSGDNKLIWAPESTVSDIKVVAEEVAAKAYQELLTKGYSFGKVIGGTEVRGLPVGGETVLDTSDVFDPKAHIIAFAPMAGG
jgi:hypothetical protein